MMIKLFVFSKPHHTWELTSKVDAGSTSCLGIGSGRVGFVNRHRFFYLGSFYFCQVALYNVPLTIRHHANLWTGFSELNKVSDRVS